MEVNHEAKKGFKRDLCKQCGYMGVFCRCNPENAIEDYEYCMTEFSETLKKSLNMYGEALKNLAKK
jgi:hypothetical protein